MAWAFLGLCVIAAATRVVAQVAMVRLGQGAVAELGVHLVRRTLMLPLRAFEALDSSALAGRPDRGHRDPGQRPGRHAALLHQHPDRGRVPGLRRLALAGDPGVRGGLRRAGDRGLRGMTAPGHAAASGAARAGQDAVVGHFRTAIGGFRELKQHRGRRAAFLAESLEPDVAASRVETVGGLARSRSPRAGASSRSSASSGSCSSYCPGSRRSIGPPWSRPCSSSST